MYVFVTDRICELFTHGVADEPVETAIVWTPLYIRPAINSIALQQAYLTLPGPVVTGLVVPAEVWGARGRSYRKP